VIRPHGFAAGAAGRAQLARQEGVVAAISQVVVAEHARRAPDDGGSVVEAVLQSDQAMKGAYGMRTAAMKGGGVSSAFMTVAMSPAEQHLREEEGGYAKYAFDWIGRFQSPSIGHARMEARGNDFPPSTFLRLIVPRESLGVLVRGERKASLTFVPKLPTKQFLSYRLRMNAVHE